MNATRASLLLSTAALTVAYAAVGAPGGGTGGRRARMALLVGAAGLAGLLLAAMQALPLAETVDMSLRAVGSNQREFCHSTPASSSRTS